MCIRDSFQIVYSDTPGLLKPRYNLQKAMMAFIETALADADVILYVTDVTERPDNEDEYIRRIRNPDNPVIVAVNKIDLSNQDELEALVGSWNEILPNAEVVPISAIKNFNLDNLLDLIINRLPEGEPFFPKDQLTDKYERFFASEIIREKVFLNYQQEIPYSVEIEIESFSEEGPVLKISALIHVTRDSQKGIMIGHRGSRLKKVGTEARLDMEEFFKRKVFLEMHVKVTKDWRDKPQMLRRFGYR